jgi:hypothetical protein
MKIFFIASSPYDISDCSKTKNQSNLFFNNIAIKKDFFLKSFPPDSTRRILSGQQHAGNGPSGSPQLFNLLVAGGHELTFVNLDSRLAEHGKTHASRFIKTGYMKITFLD